MNGLYRKYMSLLASWASVRSGQRMIAISASDGALILSNDGNVRVSPGDGQTAGVAAASVVLFAVALMLSNQVDRNLDNAILSAANELEAPNLGIKIVEMLRGQQIG